MIELNRYKWNEKENKISLTQTESGLFKTQIIDENGDISSCTCYTAGEAHKFIADTINKEK